MNDIKDYYCPHPECNHYGLRGAGNLVKAGMYTLKGSGERRQMLKCAVCGMRFSETQSEVFAGCHYDGETVRGIIVSVAAGNGIRATARALGLSKDRVNSIVRKAEAYADTMLSEMLRSLLLKEDERDELWSFIRKTGIRRKY